MTDSRPEDAAKAIVDMSNQLAAKRAIHQRMGTENQKDLAANMRIEGFKADLTWDPDKGPWRPHVLPYMKKPDLHYIDTPLSVSRRYSAAAKRAIAMHPEDIEAAIDEMVNDGFDRWISMTVLNNLGAGDPIDADGRVLALPSNDNIPITGRTTTDTPYIDLAVGVESSAFDAVEWSGINTEFHSTLTEVQQMVWDYHLAGQSNKWIAEAMDRSESTISEHLTNIKEAWATFIDAA